MKKNHGKKELITKSPLSREYNLNRIDDSNINSLENNEMLDNIIKTTGNQDVYKELKDETNKIKQLLSNSKEKLRNINLYEKQNTDIDIYQWNNLFNRSIPISAYVTSSELIKKQIDKKENNKNDIEIKENSKNLKHPVALVDLTEEEIKKYLPPPPVGIPPSQVIRFQKLPFKGNSKDTFYFSNAFNDYYKMDFKEFIKIMPVLKAKKRCNSAKLTSQIKKSRKSSNKEEQKREIYKNEMLDKLNNLFIEKQYLSLSLNSNNIQPLMSSIHSQIYPGEGDELTKHTKIYIKTNKPLGSERDIESIDFTVNQRNYQRNELNRIRFNKKRAKSVSNGLHLSTYDINDPDIDIFKRIEFLEKIINEDDNNINTNKNLKDEKEEEKSIINCEGESKEIKEVEEYKIQQSIQNNISVKEDKKIVKSENSNVNLDKNKIVNNKENQNNINTKSIRVRSMSSKKENHRDLAETLTTYNNKRNKNLPRAMSAHVMRPMRPIERQNENFIHNVYLSSINQIRHHNSYAKGKKNKLNDIWDENKKGSISSQISTYEGINSSIYEKQNIPTHGFPLKTNHEIPNKIYLKINNNIKVKQYEKDQKKLEQFTKYIHLDEAYLYEDLTKGKIRNKNSNNNSISDLKYIDKNKIFNRPLSSYGSKSELNLKKVRNSSKINLNSQPNPRKHNNYRASSKISSNENSKIELTTSLPNTKYEYFLNNNYDKVAMVYFNDLIEMRPKNINEMKPIIKNDGIIVASNYFNRGKPQLLHYHYKLKHKNNFRRVYPKKIFGEIPKPKETTIIQEEHLSKYRKINTKNNKTNENKVKRKRIFSSKL